MVDLSHQFDDHGSLLSKTYPCLLIPIGPNFRHQNHVATIAFSLVYSFPNYPHISSLRLDGLQNTRCRTIYRSLTWIAAKVISASLSGDNIGLFLLSSLFWSATFALGYVGASVVLGSLENDWVILHSIQICLATMTRIDSASHFRLDYSTICQSYRVLLGFALDPPSQIQQQYLPFQSTSFLCYSSLRAHNSTSSSRHLGHSGH